MSRQEGFERVAQKQRTRSALLEATREWLAEGKHPTVAEAADRAGISRATAYRYFSAPEPMAQEAVLDAIAREFAAVLRHAGTNAVLTLDIEGKEQLALTKALDIHPIRRNIQHADLLVVRRGEKVTVEVTVTVEGDAAPGTLVTQDANTIEIEAEALSIPEHLTVSVEGVEAGTQVLASQVELPAGVSLVSDPELLVVNVVEAPSAEDLESEGAGEAAAEAPAEEPAAEAAEAAE